MGKKIASFIPYYYSPHLELDLEIIHNHIVRGDDVTIYVCGGELPACDANISHDLKVCEHCTLRRRNGLNLIDLADKVHLRNFLNIKQSDLDILKTYEDMQVQTLDELMSIELENCQIGKTIYGELVSLKHETRPSLEEMGPYIANSLKSCALIYLSFKNHFLETRPDIFYTFNGRFVVSAPAVAAARATGITFAVHDRAAMMGRYLLVENESLHLRRYWNKELVLAWENSKHSLAEKESLAIEWYESRLKNEKQGWFSYTADQNQDLPLGFDTSKTNIVIFNSSEWEFCGIDDHKLPFYENQDEGLLRLAEDLRDQKDMQIYLRVHPHLKDKKNAQTTFIKEKLTNQFPNFEVIDGGSPVKTYNLMKHADVVITFGSSTGIEAAYQRIPSILLGPAFYEDISVCTTVRSHDELIEMLLKQTYKLSEDELNHRKAESLKYAYYQQVVGFPYTLFEQVDIFDIRFKGEKVSNQAPSYESGLKRELAQRVELREAVPNPLTSIVRELESVADKSLSENANLKSKLATVEHELSSLKQELADVLKKQNQKNFEMTLNRVSPAEDKQHKEADLHKNGYLNKFLDFLKL